MQCAITPESAASTVNTTNVPRRWNTGRNSSNTPAHDPGKIITRT
jgi:hypothetical protein